MFKDQSQRAKIVSDCNITEKIDFFQNIGIGAIIVVQFGLLTPFNVSSNVIARIFTTDKLLWYLSIGVLIWLLNANVMRIIKIPGFGILCAVLLCMGISTVVGEANNANDPWFLFAKQIGYFLFCISSIIILSSMAALKCYFRWSLYIGIILVLISVFSLLDLSEVLPKTIKAIHLQSEIESQRLTIGIKGTSGNIRGGALWFDSNNFAYLIASQIIIATYFLLTKRNHVMSILLGCVLLALFYSMVSTLSRGGLFSAILGLSVFLIFMVRNNVVRARKIVKTAVILFMPIMLIISLTRPSDFATLGKRIWFATGLLGSSASSEMGGMETSRLVTATIAFDEFLEQPIMGRGVGFQSGLINRDRVDPTGNHIGYLNILTKYGVVGFLLQFFLFWIFFCNVMRSIRYLRGIGNEDFIIGYLILALISIDLLSGFFRTVNIAGLCILPLAFYLAGYKQKIGKYRCRRMRCSGNTNSAQFENATYTYTL